MRSTKAFLHVPTAPVGTLAHLNFSQTAHATCSVIEDEIFLREAERKVYKAIAAKICPN